MNEWTKDSWRRFKIKQHPTYDDVELINSVENQLSSLPPLVFAQESDKLKHKMALASKGQAFVLQGGDCAESFSQFRANSIRDMLKVILQMSVILTFAGGCPVVKIGRMAGQFAKPRSSDTEIVDGVEYPSYRGDLINSSDFNDRKPDPTRLIKGYHQSACTLNLLRAFSYGGFADLEKINNWNLDFVSSDFGKKYKDLVVEINRSLSFMKSCGVDIANTPVLHMVDFYTSHEALVLNYEEALTRQDSISGNWYDCSAHMLWIGERTRDLDHAHVEFLRGVSNPIGVKIGPNATYEDVIGLCEKLNPLNEEGRLTFIIRMGANKIEERFPKLLGDVIKEGRNILWICDPMHGNTKTLESGYKTRKFEDIMSEITSFFNIHKSFGSVAGGIHLEMTGLDVTECLGGVQDICEDILHQRYHTQCDPRLNASQSLELGFKISEILKNR